MHTNNSNQNSNQQFKQTIQAKVHTNHSNRPSKTYIQPQFQLTIQTNNSTTQFKQTIHTNKNFPKQQESKFLFLSNINSGNTRKMVLKSNTESFVFGTKFAKQFSTTKVCVCGGGGGGGGVFETLSIKGWVSRSPKRQLLSRVERRGRSPASSGSVPPSM